MSPDSGTVEFSDAQTQDASEQAPRDAEIPPDSGSQSVDAGTNPSLPLSPGVTTLSLNQIIDGQSVSRLVRIHAPSTIDTNKDYPIVFALHGAGGNGERFTRQLQSLVNAERFVGIYPDGHNNLWNLGNDGSTADDVAFISNIVSELMNYSNLDHSRRFVLGFSNGAGMAHKVAIETNLFKAITTVVTQLSMGNEPTSTSPNVGVQQILGQDDRLIPYNGGPGPMNLNFYSGEQSAEIWAQHNGCTTPGAIDENATRIRIEYTGCNSGVKVIHYGAKGVAHNVPGNFEGGLIPLAINFFEATP